MSDTTPGPVIKTLLVDDNAILRMGLRTLMAADPRIEVVGEAEDGDQAVAACRELRPDVVLLDVRMPRRDGLSALPECLEVAKVIMLTFTDEAEVVQEAIRAGASGYLVHGTFDSASLCDTITSVVAGCRAVSDAVLRELLAATPAAGRAASGLAASGNPLSERQTEVMDAIASGLSNQQIARKLFLSEKTVKNHINQVFARLGVTTRAEAIALWVGTAPGDLVQA